MLRYVLLPERFAVDLGIKRHAYLEEDHLREALIGRSGDDAEQVRPGVHAADGSYLRLSLHWRGLSATVEAGHDGDELVVLVTPREVPPSPFELVVSAGTAWNGPGTVESTGEGLLARLPSGPRVVRVAGTTEDDPYAGGLAPHRVVRLSHPVGVATGPPGGPAPTVAGIRAVLDRRRAELETRAAAFGELAEAWLAVTSALAWNTVYEPRHERVVSTVGRLWNREYGGVALFGWDNFFLAYLAELESRSSPWRMSSNTSRPHRRRVPAERQPGERQQVLGPVAASGGRDPHAGGRPPLPRALVPRGGLRSAPRLEPLVAEGAAQRGAPRLRLARGAQPVRGAGGPHPDRGRLRIGMDDSPMYEGVRSMPRRACWNSRMWG